MIMDHLSRISSYCFENENMRIAQEFLMKHDYRTLPKEKMEIKGDEVFLVYHDITQSPLEEAFYEAHRDYADIHFTLEGVNFIRSTLIDNIHITKEYVKEGDYLLGSYEGESYTDSYMGPGYFAIYMPEDAHLTNAHPIERANVKKYVIKVKVR